MLDPRGFVASCTSVKFFYRPSRQALDLIRPLLLRSTQRTAIDAWEAASGRTLG